MKRFLNALAQAEEVGWRFIVTCAVIAFYAGAIKAARAVGATWKLMIIEGFVAMLSGLVTMQLAIYWFGTDGRKVYLIGAACALAGWLGDKPVKLYASWFDRSMVEKAKP